MTATALFCVCVLVNFLFVHGFLLYNANAKGENDTGNSNFLTVQSFLEYKNQQQLEIEQLRGTMDENTAILTSQLDIKNITRQLNQLQAKTQSLEQNNVARGQDLIALINALNDVSKRMNESINILNGKVASLNASLLAETNDLKLGVAKLNSSLLAKETELEVNQHKLFSSVAQLTDGVNKMNQKVAFTACSSRAQVQSAGYVVKFDNIKTNVGVTNPSSFISSGKFLCEHDGIYLVYVTLDAYNTNIHYSLYTNNNEYVQVYEDYNNVHDQRGCLTVTLNLHKGDTVCVGLKEDMPLTLVLQ